VTPLLTIAQTKSLLLIVDFQSRLMPSIDQGAVAVKNAKRLIEMAKLIEVPIVFTEHFLGTLPADRHIVVAGCEAHVCVLQTVLGLLGAGRKVYLVRDALGSRQAESKETAIHRMERHGAEIVTTEMVVFEWLESAEHPRFREAIALIK